VNAPWLALVIAYLLGSIPFGFLIVKAGVGGDIREQGSGNIGAANVARASGIWLGLLTLLLDAVKGYAAVFIAGRWAHGPNSLHWMIAAAMAAVIGHMFPIWLKFKGGKGVATSLGAFLPICREAVIAAAILWIIVVAFWRYSSLGSIVAAAAFPVLVYLLYAPGHAPPEYITWGTIFVSVLVLMKHYENMERLIARREPRLGPPKR
jgi:glycerol-3-phosphate acyltransferase PlsY